MNTPVEQGERKTGSYEDKHIPGFSDQKHSYLRLGWGHGVALFRILSTHGQRSIIGS
jgi:hypothetical protein